MPSVFLVQFLLLLGLAGGDPVIWCGPNSVEVLVTLHAARKAGLVAVPLAYRFTADEMRYVIADSGAAVVLVDPEQAERIAAVRAELPAVREVVVFGSPEWHALLDGPGTPPPPPDGTGGSMIYTSGTTGKPKGAVRGPTDPEYTRTLAATLRLRPHEEVHLTTGPLYHSGPLAWALLTHALGGTVVLLRRFDAAAGSSWSASTASPTRSPPPRRSSGSWRCPTTSSRGPTCPRCARSSSTPRRCPTR